MHRVGMSCFLALVALPGLTTLGRGGSALHEPSPQEAQLQAEDDVVYVCPPCGIHCDRVHHNAAGQCPVCGMGLIDKNDLVQAAILLLPRVPLSEASGPAQALFASRGFFTYTVAAEPDALFSQELFKVTPAHSLQDSPLPEVLVVAGGNMDALQDEALLEWVRKAAENAGSVLGVGRGVVILAKAGLLKDKEAALPRRYSRLLEYHQLQDSAQFRGDLAWVQSGKFVTAASADAAMDAAIIVVEEVLGRSLARQTAQRLGRPVPERQQ